MKEFLKDEEIKHQKFFNENQKGFIEDIDIFLIGNTQCSDPHKREFYIMKRLKTLPHYGLNTEEKYCKNSFSNITRTYYC